MDLSCIFLAVLSCCCTRERQLSKINVTVVLCPTSILSSLLSLLQGADVNGGDHEHQYTALHFAALAGKPKVCELLLQEGAKIDATNSVKRTASQMGAFVGNLCFLYFSDILICLKLVKRI